MAQGFGFCEAGGLSSPRRRRGKGENAEKGKKRIVFSALPLRSPRLRGEDCRWRRGFGFCEAGGLSSPRRRRGNGENAEKGKKRIVFSALPLRSPRLRGEDCRWRRGFGFCEAGGLSSPRRRRGNGENAEKGKKRIVFSALPLRSPRLRGEDCRWRRGFGFCEAGGLSSPRRRRGNGENAEKGKKRIVFSALPLRSPRLRGEDCRWRRGFGFCEAGGLSSPRRRRGKGENAEKGKKRIVFSALPLRSPRLRGEDCRWRRGFGFCEAGGLSSPRRRRGNGENAEKGKKRIVFSALPLRSPRLRGEDCRSPLHPQSSSSCPTLSTARKASWGISTRPTRFMRFLPSFCFSSSLRLREMSPP